MSGEILMLILGGLDERHALQCAFALGQRKTTSNFDRFDRSQDLPDALTVRHLDTRVLTAVPVYVLLYFLNICTDWFTEVSYMY
jgi:hypothetical protein